MATTTTTTFKQLERTALESHRRGERWSQFWPLVSDDLRALIPWDRRAYGRAVERLLCVLVSGDTSGLEPPNSSPWEWDDCPPSTAPAIADCASPAREGKTVDLSE